MTKAIDKQAMALQERIRDNMHGHRHNEGLGVVVSRTRQALAEERIEIITDYKGKHADMVADLRVELLAFPVGSDTLKARKQSWKRSFSKAFSKVYPELELSFTQDQPLVKPATPTIGKTWQEKVTEVMEENGASEKLIAATLRTMQKEIEAEQARIEKAKADNDNRLKLENAARVEALRAELAELEKVS